MTLSQRLTRAGLTFILLGSVAAILPQHEMAIASSSTGTCSGTTEYEVFGTSNMDGSVGNLIPAGTSETLTAYEGPTNPPPVADPGSVFFTESNTTDFTYTVTGSTITLHSINTTTIPTSTGVIAHYTNTGVNLGYTVSAQ